MKHRSHVLFFRLAEHDHDAHISSSVRHLQGPVRHHVGARKITESDHRGNPKLFALMNLRLLSIKFKNYF